MPRYRLFFGKVNLKNETDVEWLLMRCKQRPKMKQRRRGAIQQLTEFSLDDFMQLEFKSWLCICEHEYLKLVQVTLFKEVIDRNLIVDHNLFTCQELIISGMFVINLAILKSLVDDRNSFIIEEMRNLNLKLNVSSDLDSNNEDKPQYVSQNIEKVVTDS